MRPPDASSGAHPEEQTVTVGPWTITTLSMSLKRRPSRQKGLLTVQP